MKNQQQKWFALEITANSAVSEAVEFALNELDALGTEINNLGKITPETLDIRGYFNEKISDENVNQAVKFALEIYGFSEDSVKNSAWREVENQDWLAEWKKHWKPTESAKFIIAPTWETIENTEKIVVRIEPSMAFGTGTHETTRLCLQAIEENYKAGESFFDVGTGTGILAVCAAKIQGKRKKEKGKILACDTDEDSIKIARENAGLNDVGAEIEFFVGSIDENSPKFDFVCANVTLDVIVPLLPLLLEKSKRILVLSGILKEQENAICGELKKFGLEKPQIETMGEWISVVVNRKK